MTSTERVFAAITGDTTDYQPFTLLLSLYGASLIQSNTLDYYRNPQLWFQGQQAVVQAFDPDILISPFSFPIEAEAFGSELVFLNQYAPNIKKPILTDLAQIQDLPSPSFENSLPIQFFLQGTSLLTQNYKDKVTACPLHSPCDMPALLMGIEKWIDTLLFEPAYMEQILEKTLNHFVRLGNEFLARGAAFLIVPVNFTNPSIITEAIFKKLIPYLESAFRQIKGAIVVHNGGCKVMPFIDRFAKLPNVVGIVLDPSEKFEDARQIVGDKMVLMGNFDGPNFVNMSQKQAQEKCLSILDNRKNDPHFIFATSDADIPYQTPVSSIQSVVETLRNFKKL